MPVSPDLVTVRVPQAARDAPAGEVRALLAGHSFESIHDVAVLDAERLVGLVPIERLLAARPDCPLSAIMDLDPPTMTTAGDLEAAAWRMVASRESSIAVRGPAGEFAGLIPPRRLARVLLAEHDEDLARLGGYLSQSSKARTAAEEDVARRLWHRLPWLLVGLMGAMASAAIVGGFEEQLDRKVLLAFFIPAVVYMADAVGTQTEAVLIRGLAVGIDVRRVAARELATGVIAGLVVGAAFLPFALVAWDDTRVAVAVALALMASCSIATLVAMALPLAFNRLGRDPAFGSGPLATVLQDLLSIVVYLGIATSIAI